MIAAMLFASCDGGGGDGDGAQDSSETARSLNELLVDDQIRYDPGLETLFFEPNTDPSLPPLEVIGITSLIRFISTDITESFRQDPLLYVKTGDNLFILKPDTVSPTAQERMAEAVNALLNGSTGGAAVFKQLVENKTLPSDYPSTPAPFTDDEIQVMAGLLTLAGADIVGDTFLTGPKGQGDFWATDGNVLRHTNTSTIDGLLQTRSISGQYDELRLRRKVSFVEISDAFNQGRRSVIPVISDA